MGLDMYVFNCGKTQMPDTDGVKPESATEFAYWRKFNNLHGWMHKRYIEAGGKDPDFNCSTLRLTRPMLVQLEVDATEAGHPNLQPTSGFFFGTQDPLSPEDEVDILRFIARAREALDAGDTLVYYAWY